MESVPLRQAQLTLAMYAIHVWLGSSLFCQQIRLATIQNYVNDAASLIAMAGKARDVRKDCPTDTRICKILTDVYSEIKRYEKVPNRREPVTVEMLRYAKQLAVAANDPLSLEAALADWWEAALLGGF